MNPPLFSVVVNVRNGATFLDQALKSIYNQTEPSWEVILFDNHSTDDTRKIVDSYDRRIRYFYSSVPLSLGEARNQALLRCRGDFICFLDSDDVWYPEKLEAQKKIFHQYPEVGIIFSNYHHWLSEQGKKVLALRDRKHKKGNFFSSQLKNYTIGILTVAFRSEVLKEIDCWFDSNLTLAEDYDFFLKILLKTEAYYISDALAAYRIHSKNLSAVLAKQWRDEKERVLKKIEQTFPEAQKQFYKELSHIRLTNALTESRAYFFEGDYKRCEEILRPYRFKSLLCFISYWLCHFPKVWHIGYIVYQRISYGFRRPMT